MKNLFEYSGELGLLFVMALFPVFLVLSMLYAVVAIIRPKPKEETWQAKCDKWEQTQKQIIDKGLTPRSPTPYN